jgi:catechol-2,3-dioxygenase
MSVYEGFICVCRGSEDGPTLEIFQYEPEQLRSNLPTINQQGLGHLAFHVDDVAAVLTDLIEHGGRQLGDLVQKQYESLRLLTAVYAADPEGNCIEIQNWSK